MPAAAGLAIQDRKPVPYLQTPFNEHLGQFSADGRWMASASDESGRFEVYVRAFPDVGTRLQISTLGGTEPRWRRDGRELFYAAPDGTLMAAAVQANSTFSAGVPRALFKSRFATFGAGEGTRPVYVPTADGERFLINMIVEEAATSPVTVVLNWRAARRR